MLKLIARKVLILATGVTFIVNGTEDDFRINQLGYYPEANKVVPVLGTKDSTFELVDSTGNMVFQSSLSKDIRWSLTGDTVRQADFSGFKKEGTYWLKVGDRGRSLPIYIRSNVLYDVSLSALKTFYFQRASIPLEQKYAGKYARKAGHLDTLCFFHTSTGKDSAATGSSSGGWYDAGDFGKYVVNAGVTLGNMFFFYENFGDYFGDSALNIPESDNGIDDLLDEIKYELDWLITMQDTDGGVFHKLTTLQHAGINLMPDEDDDKRFFIGKSTAASLDFAAVMAMAGRIYKKIDSYENFGDTCINRAESAWNWAVNNPDQFFRRNPSGVGTGTYDDTVLVEDEFLWAASELFITTSKVIYKDSLRIDDLDYSWPADWKTPGRLAPLSLATVSNDLESSEIESIRENLLDQADDYLNQIKKHAFRIPNGRYYYWGSNGVFANAGLFLLAAFKISDDTTYARAAAEIADYLLGKNAVSNSFLTGFGIQRSQFPHHRQCIADTVNDAIPGFLVGGPNGLPNTYNDASGDYETNEVAINWNGPAVALFAGINKIFGKNIPTIDDGQYFLIQIINGPGKITLSSQKNLYSAGDEVTITAIPDDGQMFLGWNGAALGIDTQVTIHIANDTRIVANFGKPGEIVKNGDFSKQTTGWSLLGGRGSVSGGQYKITISNPGTQDWSIQLIQNGIPLLKNATYVFKFEASSDSTRTIIADVAKSSGDYSSYMGAKSCKLDTVMKKFEWKFKMKKATDMGARITFNCGLSEKPVIIDNISLMIYDPLPVVEERVQKQSFLQKMSFRVTGNQMVLQLPLLDPDKADLKIFDIQGRMVKNLTSSIRKLDSGNHLLIMEKNFTAGMYLVRYFDGSNFHTDAWTNIHN